MCQLSIITVTYNNCAGLDKTISSVKAQSFSNYEHIVIDGGSTDGSVALLQKSKDRYSWVSERDNGIYHAMNKGLALAKGDYILMLNAGDTLCAPETLTSFFAHGVTADVVYGNTLYVSEEGGFEKLHPAKLSFDYFKRDFLNHQSTFIKRQLHQQVGLYDEGLKVVSDWKFMVLAICLHSASYQHIPVQVATCELDGMSNQFHGKKLAGAERTQTLQKYFSAFLPDYEQHEQVLLQLQQCQAALLPRVQRKLKSIFS